MIKICKNPKNYKLTLNKEYEIEESNGNYVKLINDTGKLVRYDSSLFEDLVVVPPPPPPPPIRTENQIIQSVNVARQNTNLIFSYRNRDNNLVQSVPKPISYQNPDFSCGIETMDGLSNLIDEIENVVDTEHDDYINLKNHICTRCINKIKEFSRTRNRGAIIFSTNEDLNHEDYYNWLNEMSMSTTEWFNNPNSGNNIKIWCIKTY